MKSYFRLCRMKFLLLYGTILSDLLCRNYNKTSLSVFIVILSLKEKIYFNMLLKYNPNNYFVPKSLSPASPRPGTI